MGWMFIKYQLALVRSDKTQHYCSQRSPRSQCCGEYKLHNKRRKAANIGGCMLSLSLLKWQQWRVAGGGGGKPAYVRIFVSVF